MPDPGPLLASGRDADIYEFGPGRVLRRSRGGRSLAGEAAVMTYLAERGYPVPAVDELRENGTALVMERIEGPTMADAVLRAPWTVRRQGRTLADLHHRLHRIDPPATLPTAPVGTGDVILHLDLHPLNVLMSPRGPVVIDWCNAARGDPYVDVGLAWLLMATGELPGFRATTELLAWARRPLISAFLGGFDRTATVQRLRTAVTWKAHDPHMHPREVAAMWRLVDRSEARWGRNGAPPPARGDPSV